MSLTFTSGIVVFIQADKENEWWLAQEWQKTHFFSVMKFGEMKSMGGYIIATETTEEFTHNNFRYKFIIENGWGPVTLENITTGKKRQIRYLCLDNKDNSDDKYRMSNIF